MQGRPTPGENWDDTFWCGAWTDYHNTVETSAIWALRSGEVDWLDELAFPGALRTLHTQIMQCGPDEKWFYCGQAPTGYGAYRADFNSSHAYFENLFLYYWLTGDSTVVDMVPRGGRQHAPPVLPVPRSEPVTAPHGPDGPACAATQPPDNDSSTFTGRVPSQWTAAFRFLGLASEDPSFLEDYRSGLARAVTQQYLELERGGKSYGFLGEQVGEGPGVYEAGPAWTNGFYDAENLYRLQRDTATRRSASRRSAQPHPRRPGPHRRRARPGRREAAAADPDAPWPRAARRELDRPADRRHLHHGRAQGPRALQPREVRHRGPAGARRPAERRSGADPGRDG